MLLTLKASAHRWMNAAWYEPPFPSYTCLCIFEKIYTFFLKLHLSTRRVCLSSKKKPDTIIWSVTNLTVGGNAKTPMVMHLATVAHHRGLRVAIMTRGYKRAKSTPRFDLASALVLPGDSAAQVGDEAKMMACKLEVPVYCVDDPVSFLEQHGASYGLWVVDDAWSRLQHWSYAWWMLDGVAGLGNGRQLPLGPLRFPISMQSDPVLSNIDKAEESSFFPIIKGFRSVSDGNFYTLEQWPFSAAVVVTGVAKPKQVIRLLEASLNMKLVLISFPDHVAWPETVTSIHECVLLTEKDAARIEYAADNLYVIELEYRANPALQKRIDTMLDRNFDFRNR